MTVGEQVRLYLDIEEGFCVGQAGEEGGEDDEGDEEAGYGGVGEA